MGEPRYSGGSGQSCMEIWVLEVPVIRTQSTSSLMTGLCALRALANSRVISSSLLDFAICDIRRVGTQALPPKVLLATCQSAPAPAWSSSEVAFSEIHHRASRA